MKDQSFDIIAEAFSRTAEKYDAFAQDHPHLTRMRNKVYGHINRLLPRGSRILELNAGTGVDAVELARRGYIVHATDIAPGMLERARYKINRSGMNDRVTVQECSFMETDKIQGAPFDAVFSNLGGLNCIPDLSLVINKLSKILHSGGVVTWVLMPHVCLWEMAEVFRGNFRVAFRRFSHRGVQTHLEGLHFDVYYFSPHQVINRFGDDFELLSLEGLSVITPTAESKNFAKFYPSIYRGLSFIDDRLSPHWPWYGWGDFYILSFRQKSRL